MLLSVLMGEKLPCLPDQLTACEQPFRLFLLWAYEEQGSKCQSVFANRNFTISDV